MRLLEPIRLRALPLLLVAALAFGPLPLAQARDAASDASLAMTPAVAESAAAESAVAEPDGDSAVVAGTADVETPEGGDALEGDPQEPSDQVAADGEAFGGEAPGLDALPVDEAGLQEEGEATSQDASAADADAGDFPAASPEALAEEEAGAADGDAPADFEAAAGDGTPADSPLPAAVPQLLAVQAAPSYVPTLQPVKGVLPLLVIVAGFLGEDGGDAVPSENAYDWGNTIFASDEGVSAFYRDMSDGAFTFAPAAETSAYGVDGNTNAADAVNDGIVHVSLSEGHGHWGDAYYSDGKVASAMLATFTRIVQAADAFVNFAQYDADGNGVIDESELAIAFIIAGYEAATDDGAIPASVPLLWSHAWSYSDADVAPPVADGVKIDRYIAIAEKLYGEDGEGEEGARQEPLSVLMHELAHNLGLPDLYDTSGDTSGAWSDYQVGASSLMDTGTWASVTSKAGATSYVPSSLDVWSRYELGWTAPTVVKKSGTYTVSAQGSANGYSTLLIPTGRAGEYYLLENRQFSGHDAGLADYYPDYPSGGIIIWHIDNGVVKRYLADNQVNVASHRPGVMPLFWEEDEDWDYSLSFGASTPDSSLVFWSLKAWNEYFARYADALDLPLYGAGANADDPLARFLSGIKIEFLSDAGPDMQVRITFPADELPDAVQDDAAKPVAKKADVAAVAAAPASAGVLPADDAPLSRPTPATGDDAPFAALCSTLLALLACAACVLTLCRLRHGFAGVVSLRVTHEGRGWKWHW